MTDADVDRIVKEVGMELIRWRDRSRVNRTPHDEATYIVGRVFMLAGAAMERADVELSGEPWSPTTIGGRFS